MIHGRHHYASRVLSAVDKDLLYKAIGCLAIRDVYFEKASAETKEGFDPSSFTEPLAVQFKVGVIEVRRCIAVEDPAPLVRIVAQCAMRLIGSVGSNDVSDEDEKALISAVLVAEYQVLDELEPEALQEFSEQNGLFHAWPFWREYVHSACARLRLPPIPVPMYKLPSPPTSITGQPAFVNACEDTAQQQPKRKRSKKLRAE